MVRGEQRNKWQGPAAGGGKDAVYAGCEIEPTERSATEAGSAFQLGVLLRFFPPFLFSPVLQFNLLALSTSAVRTRAISLVLGLSFYPLEQAPNMVIYAMSKSGTATSGLI